MTWKRQWGYELEKTKTPGVYRMRTGGHYVSAKVTHPTTGARIPIDAALHDVASVQDARLELDRLVAAEKAKWIGLRSSRQPWIDFAVSVLEERVQRGSIKSAATIELWRGTLKVFAAAWGSLDVTAVTNTHYRHWLATDVKRWMTEGRTTTRKRKSGRDEVKVTKVLGPEYVNGWLRILSTISNEATDRFDLPKNPYKGIKPFVVKDSHTIEQPNALPPGELLERFVATARELYPQHAAFIVLGFVTGLRPSLLRPLRRKGPEADLNWTTGRLLVRRSHSRGQEIMNDTKTKRDGDITLPSGVLDILREHVAALEGEAAASDLLFPGDGEEGLRARTGMTKPFAAIVKAMGLPYRLTPKGMRRTFNDVARLAGTHDIVLRSISGHQGEDMQRRYSTAQRDEQRVAIANVLKATGALAGKRAGKVSGKVSGREVPSDA